MKKAGYWTLVLLAALAGCAEEQTTYFECSICDKDFATVEDVVELVTGSLPIGAACTGSDECLTGTCFCGESGAENCSDLTEFADEKGVSWPFVMTGGMCSELSCDPLQEAACGDGSICLDMADLFNSEESVGFCLKYCEEYTDCRYDEGYVCYYTGVEKQRACLPAALVAELPCGNGACDPNETVETCPRDCQ